MDEKLKPVRFVKRNTMFFQAGFRRRLVVGDAIVT